MHLTLVAFVRHATKPSLHVSYCDITELLSIDATKVIQHGLSMSYSAFFWLLSLMFSSLIWLIPVDSQRNKFVMGVVISVIFQELFRFLFYFVLR